MCNFVGCINKAKKHGLKRIKILRQSIQGHAETLKLTLSQLLLISTFVSLQDELEFLLAGYRLKYGDSFPPESELHSTRRKSRKMQLIPILIEKEPVHITTFFVSCIFR